MGWYCVDWIDLSLEVYNNNNIYLWKRVIWSYSDYHCYLGVHVNTFLVCVYQGCPQNYHIYTQILTQLKPWEHTLFDTDVPALVCFHFFYWSIQHHPTSTNFSWLCVPGNKAGKCWRTSAREVICTDFLTLDIQHIWMVVSNIFHFHPHLGKIPILTNIFQRGWNHQLDILNVSKGLFGATMYCYACSTSTTSISPLQPDSSKSSKQGQLQN